MNLISNKIKLFFGVLVGLSLLATCAFASIDGYKSALSTSTVPPFSTDYAAVDIDNGIIGFAQGISGQVIWGVLGDVAYDAAGRISLYTVLGSELDANDNNSALTWGAPYPSGDFGYISVGVTDAAQEFAVQRYGTDEGGAGGGWILAPYKMAGRPSVQSHWTGPGGVQVWMRAELIQDTWKFNFWFENTGDDPVIAQVRWAGCIQMLDASTPVTGPTALEYVLPQGLRPWILDHILSSPNLPPAIDFFIDKTKTAPSLHFITQSDDMHPDQVGMDALAVGGLGRTVGAIWGSTTLPDVEASPTAIALTSSEIVLPGRYHMTTDAGLGDPTGFDPDAVIYVNLATGVTNAFKPMALGTEAPRIISYNPLADPSLSPNPFEIIARVTNLYQKPEGPADLQNILVSIDLPTGYILLDNDAQKSIDRLAPNETQAVRWRVYSTGANTGIDQYRVVASVQQPYISKITANNLVTSVTDSFKLRPRWVQSSIPFEFPGAQPLWTTFGLTRGTTRQVRWDPVLGQWTGITLNERGRGFFVKLQQASFDLSVKLANASEPTGELTQIYAIPLDDGWNQIGNPWLYPISLKQLQFINPDDPRDTLSFDEALGLGLIRNALWDWNPDLNNGIGDYVLANDPSSNTDAVLEPMKGYFIKVTTGRERRLQVLYPFVSIPGAGIATTGVSSLITRSVVSNDWASPSRNQWRLGLTARTAKGASNTAYFGVSSTSVDGYDVRDIESPPSFPGGVQVLIDHRAWPSPNSGFYRQDIRSATTSRNVYSMIVTTDVPQIVSLNWLRPDANMAGYRMKLVDKVTNKTITMSSTTFYSFRSNGTRRFEIILEKIAPAAIRR
jgi:hypothetical protein